MKIKNLTPEQACTAYQANPDECPYCGGCIVAGEMTGDGDCQHQQTHCQDCDAAFTETYRLESVVVDAEPTEAE